MPTNSHAYATFEALFRAHYNALANYAYSILKNRQNAEDVVQDVFIKLWKNQPEVINTSQVRFYLLTATKNGCISLLRKQAGQVTTDPDELQLAAVPDTSQEDKDEIKKLVNKALALLPPQCLVIFKLSRFGGLTYQQIASELGLSVKTVENQMGKALRILRDYARQNNIPYIVLLYLIYGT
ncbi:RNA polymerase sigma-70 factor [Niastella caeni]|uniref:RNA polymerase sigma-70 factor n=1 Tax=Niastella caeni TaxID=2569763 RepID=A0A4S8H911_9BACT|nr:RNA polymerase sigma-70 factor [Niastella caeni]THU31127.1 RNA polymerase sigma-70 factor [Niastella caeni]